MTSAEVAKIACKNITSVTAWALRHRLPKKSGHFFWTENDIRNYMKKSHAVKSVSMDDTERLIFGIIARVQKMTDSQIERKVIYNRIAKRLSRRGSYEGEGR